MKRFTTVSVSLILFLFTGGNEVLQSGEPANIPADKSAPKLPQPGKAPAAPERKKVLSSSPGDSPLVIQLVEDKSVWEASLVDVQAVLDSAGAELIRYFPGRNLHPITVYSKGGPITLYRRDASGGYTVKLQTGKTFWSQYSYQFSHELCHILCNYRDDKNPNGWFEESLCEVASLFVLRGMGKTWEKTPPYPNWQSYHSSLADYAQKRIDESGLHEHRSLKEWFAQWEPKLRESPSQRKLNNVVAAKLLPLFEKTPDSWEAVSWLNVEPSFPDDTFETYLRRWRHYVPERHREFVEIVASQFGIAFE